MRMVVVVNGTIMLIRLRVLLDDRRVTCWLTRRQASPLRWGRDGRSFIVDALGLDVMRDRVDLATSLSSRGERHRKRIPGIARRRGTTVTEFLSGLDDCRPSQRGMAV